VSDFIQQPQENDVVRKELCAGLMAAPAFVAPKYFYDVLGSRLFEAICALPEYYPTRTESAIFQQHAAQIAERCGTGGTLIDLGAGNCAKAAQLFPVLQPGQYVALDISADFVKEAVAGLQQRFPAMAMEAIGIDFSSSLELPPSVRPQRRLFFYPGSSIGNFAPPQALAFLRRIREACQHRGVADGALLIGVDLVKDHATLEAAYDDALGVTAAFNLNLLRHLNTLMGSNFDVRDWRHRGFFNPVESRIEMHLEARRDLQVRWPNGARGFAEGERIHTESSYKYTPARFAQLLQQAGFGAVDSWTDPHGWFMVCHARAL
jgi:dimethylhistidine N-methyltransferase